MSKPIRYIFFAVILLAGSLPLRAEGDTLRTISLEEVRAAAESHFPLLRQREVMDRVVRESSRAMKYVYIPQISLTGGVNYLSDVPNPTKQDLIKGEKLQVAIPSFLKQMGFTQEVWDGMMDETMASIASQIKIPSIPKMQRGVGISVAQLLWDGGHAAAEGAVMRASQAQSDARMEEVLREVRKSVTEIYFGLLKVDGQTALQTTLIEELRRQEERVEVAIANDVGWAPERMRRRSGWSCCGRLRIALHCRRRAGHCWRR